MVFQLKKRCVAGLLTVQVVQRMVNIDGSLSPVTMEPKTSGLRPVAKLDENHLRVLSYVGVTSVLEAGFLMIVTGRNLKKMLCPPYSAIARIRRLHFPLYNILITTILPHQLPSGQEF